jgi:hypothetical protein
VLLTSGNFRAQRTGIISEIVTTNIKTRSTCAVWWSGHDTAPALDSRLSQVCGPRALATSSRDSGRAPLFAASRPTPGAAVAFLGRLSNSAAHTTDAASPLGSIAHGAAESIKECGFFYLCNF